MLLLLSIAIGVVDGLVLSLPQRTPPEWTFWRSTSIPKPTAAPLLRETTTHIDARLRRRQDGVDKVHTCGWFDGNAESPLTCSEDRGCYYYGDPSYFDCCPIDSNGYYGAEDTCPYGTTCIDYSDDGPNTGEYETTSDYSVLW